jgi:hypothetical protein
MVYLAKKGNGVIHHTSLQAMKEIDGVETPDMEITDGEFEAAGCLARLVNGGIVIGKTDTEKQAEENADRIRILKDCLAQTDYVAVKIAEGAATKAEYAERLARRQAWRQEIAELEATA